MEINWGQSQHTQIAWKWAKIEIKNRSSAGLRSGLLDCGNPLPATSNAVVGPWGAQILEPEGNFAAGARGCSRVQKGGCKERVQREGVLRGARECKCKGVFRKVMCKRGIIVRKDGCSRPAALYAEVITHGA